MQLILAVDGSTVSARAARHVAKLAFGLRELPRLVLLTVDPPMMPGVERKLGKAAIKTKSAPFGSAVSDFYLSNPIARASAVMGECAAMAAGLRQAAE